MPELDLILKGARVLTSQSDGMADIGISNGVITALGSITTPTIQTIDATGKIITPGGVDAHCHIEQLSGMGLMNADTFETATRSAAIGGTTTTISFAPQSADMPLADALKDYEKRAARGALIDHAFHIILSDLDAPDIRRDLRNAIRAGHRSIKVFTTYNIQLSDRDICDVLAIAKEEGALVCVHAENDGLIGWTKDQLLKSGKTTPPFHAISHPRLAEIEAVDRLIRFAEFFATPVMLFHISTREAVDAIRSAKARGVPVWAETCPHYLFMTAEVLDADGDTGAKWMCSPPQRTKDDHCALWDGLNDGTLSLVSSDHAPYRFDKTGKLSAGPGADFSKKANGLPGLEVRMPLMFDAMMNGEKLTPQKFVELNCTAPARLHGLPNKGDIAPGYDADLVIWDSEKTITYGANDLHDNVGYNPWEGYTITGWPTHVFLRGQEIVTGGALQTDPGRGRWITRPHLGITTDATPAREYVEATR